MKQNTAYTDLRSWWRKHKVSKLIWTVAQIIPYVMILIFAIWFFVFNPIAVHDKLDTIDRTLNAIERAQDRGCCEEYGHLVVDDTPWEPSVVWVNRTDRTWPPLNNSEHGGSYINYTYYSNLDRTE